MLPQNPKAEQQKYSELGSHSAIVPSSSGYSVPHLPSGRNTPLLVNVGCTGFLTGAGAGAATKAGAGAEAGRLPPVETK